MSVETLAAAIFGSKPIFLYRFFRGNSSWLLNTSKNDVTRTVHGSASTFLSAAIRHDKIVDSDFAYRSELTLTLPLSNSFSQVVLGSGFSNSLEVEIFRTETDVQQIIPVFKGEVLTISPDDQSGSLQLVCLTDISSRARKGLVGSFHRPCRHIHYGRGCELDLANFETAATIISIGADKRTILLAITGTVPSDGDSVYGIFRRIADDQQRLIVSNQGSTYVINAFMPGLEAGDAVAVSPGCNLSRQRCDSRFNNIENFGGFPFVQRNPFDGKQVF